MCEACGAEGGPALGHGDEPGAAWLWRELTLAGRRWSLARRPYLRAWCAGELTGHDLQVHAAEHDHVVVALAAVARRAAHRSPGLLGTALAAHVLAGDDVGAWRAHARAVGWSGRAAWGYGEDPFAETAACTRALLGDDGEGARTLGADLATLLAVTRAHAEAAPSMGAALREHHGLGPSGTAWFTAQAAGGAERAALLRAALQGVLADEDPHAVLRQAAAAHRALYVLHDRLNAHRLGRTPGRRAAVVD